MSFRLQLIISIVLLIAITFGIGGTLLICASFHASISEQTDAAFEAYETVLNTLSLLNTLTEQLSREYGISFRNVRSSERRELRFLRIPQHDDDDANDGSAPGGEILSLPSFASLEGGDSDGE